MDVGMVWYESESKERPMRMRVGIESGKKGTLKKAKELQKEYVNTAPVLKKSGKYELDFGGRARQASRKNFQIWDGDELVVQVGKVSSAQYNMDFGVSPFLAFAVGLSCFDQRIGEE